MEIRNNRLIYNHLRYQTPYSYPQTFMKHTHNMYEIIFFEKGEATYVIEDRKYQLKKNDLIFTRPFKYHYIEIKSNTEYSRFNILFDNSIVDKELTKRIPEEIEVLNCPKESILADIFSRLDYYSAHFDEAEFTKLVTILLKELLYNLRLSGDNTMNIPKESSPLLTQALNYINDNLFSIKSIKEVSAHCFVSEQYLFRQFQQQLKISPKKYLNTKRLLHAQKMIQKGKKPIEVYLLCGFETYVGFYKQYVKTFGYPPSQEKQIKTL